MNKYLAAATAACLWVAPWGMSSALVQEAACAGEITAAQDHFASGTFNRGEAMLDSGVVSGRRRSVIAH